MRIATVLKAVAVLIIAVIVGGVVVLINTDFNQYKALIAAEVKEATGRTLVIDGDIELELSLNPSLSVSGVKFQNADWGSQPDMLTVDQFSAQVSLLPLLSKTIEVQHVLLRGADILIEQDAKGRANFVFETAGSGKSTKTESRPAGGETPQSSASDQLPIPDVRKVLIEDARLILIDNATGGKRILNVDQISLHGEEVDASVDLTFGLTMNNQPINGKGRLGSLSAITDPDVAWPISIVLDAGGANVSLEGSMQDAVGLKGVDFKIGIVGESLATLSGFAAAQIPPVGPYSMSARLHGNLRSSLKVSNISIKVGKSDLNGDFDLHLGGIRPKLNAVFRSTLVDLADFSSVPDKGSAAPDKSVDAGKQPVSQGDVAKVIPNTPLPVTVMKLVDADVKLVAKRLLAKGTAVENISLGVALQNGDLNVTLLRAELAKGTIDGRIQLGTSKGVPRLNVSTKLSSIDAGKLLTDMNVTDLLEGSISSDVELIGQGNTVRQLAAGLNGSVKTVMGKGRIKTNALDTFIGGPTGIITKLVSGDKKEFTVLNCVVSQTEIKKGLATLKLAVIDTEFARITAAGTADLGSEALAFVITPEPKSATLNFAVAVKVGGTFASPSYGLDELSVLRKLGGTILGIGFPPAMLLGLGELGVDGESPCLKSESSDGKPTTAVDKGTVKSVTEGAGKLLKGLFGK